MGQMIPINLPADGNWPTIVGDSIMIIGPRQNELTEEQRYFNPVYLMTYPGKEHLKAQMIRAGACDCDPTIPNRRIGVFSVAPDKKVSFSQGNLQYLPAINLWKFADTQYEYLGNANKYLKPTFRNWVDLFGWSANNTTAPFGVSTSTNAADYAGDFVDWGTNTICGDAPGTWRTLSIEEWEYIYHGRKNADQLLAIATLEGVPGLILLPDNWQQPEDIPFVSSVEQGLAWDATIVEGSYFDATNKDHTKDNIYTQAQWQKMEALGAVFLPCAGWRQEKTWTHAGIVEVNIKYLGSYWSCSTPQISNDYYFFRFTQQEIRKFPLNNSLSLLARGRSVRLVHDTIVPKPPKRIGVFSVAADKQVSFSQGNLQYIQSTKTWQFAKEQYELIGEDYTTLGIWDLFGWSGKDNNAPFGVSESANVVDYRGEFVDWGKNRIGNDAPATWRTLSRDEWQYLIEIRPKADELYGVAMVAGVQGMILLPDDWVCPEGIIFNHGCHAKDNVENFAKHQTFSQEQWSIMEEAGAIFLPAAGIIYPPSKTITSVAGGAHYYSSDQKDADNAIFFGFRSSYYTINSSANRIRRSVRLVHDTIVPKVEPDPCLVVKVNDTLSINMMCVEGGTFMMGAMEGDTQAHANEKPAHEVTLTYDYYIGQTEVTQALWKAVMGNNPSTMIGDDLPVNNVLWEEADAFVKRLSQMTGYTFHLPTEAEWEFAARGGKENKGYLYAGSDDVNEVAWYADNSGGTTHAVGTKKPNELGIYDMSGNVWEWCSDWLAPYSAEAQVNPIGPATGEYHVYRGGGWAYGRGYTRSSHRRTTTQGYVKTALGLRVAIREKIEPEAVDLGLSVKWANFNVGAFHPTHCGDYFAWGETEPKETYSWATYKWCDGTSTNMTKYNTEDRKTILEPADDVAQVHWGGKWRMPTKEEIEELIDNCTWSESIQNGVKGYVVTSKHTGNSIFFPYSGYFNHDNSATLQGEKTLFYTWSAEHSDNTRGYDINNRAGAILLEQNTRRCGFPIRPVYDDRVE